jgi:diacylglycerol kinase (ATP)
MFQKIERANTVWMDRWQIDVSDEQDDGSPPGDPIPYNIINNYFSVGVVSILCELYLQHLCFRTLTLWQR